MSGPGLACFHAIITFQARAHCASGWPSPVSGAAADIRVWNLLPDRRSTLAGLQLKALHNLEIQLGTSLSRLRLDFP
jgi:hypothetical protein